MRMREQLYDCQAYENYQLVISRSARSGAAEFSDISFVSPSPTGQTASKRQSLEVAHSPLWSGALQLSYIMQSRINYRLAKIRQNSKVMHSDVHETYLNLY